MAAMLTAGEAAAILGVRVNTLYAYVSRGVLKRQRKPAARGGSVSLFDAAEVAQLAQKRSRPRAGGLDVVVDTRITHLDARGNLAFRGHQVRDLVRQRTFESASCLLWEQEAAAWEPVDHALLEAVSLRRTSAFSDRILIALHQAASADPHRADRSPGHVYWVAQQAVYSSLAALGIPVLRNGCVQRDVLGGPDVSDRLDVPGAISVPDRIDVQAPHIASSLLGALSPLDPTPARVHAVNAALILLLDHELAAATVAARIAASLHADPWMCLSSGLSAMTGVRHAGAAGLAFDSLEGWLNGGELGQRPAGFGHCVYEGPDPRLEILWDAVRTIDPALIERVDQLATETARAYGLHPNVDLGLALLARALRFPRGTPEALFMLARIPGLAAHVVEEYPHRARYRSRSRRTE